MVVMSYILLMMAGMLWILRITATVMTTLGSYFPISVYNMALEIPLLFITFFSFLFIIKRKILGALVYMFTYVGYFGMFLYNIIKTEQVNPDNYLNILISILCIVIPIFIFLDIGLNKNQKNISLDKKTDWFYKNEQFDRQFDDRADRNQYKF